MKTHNKNNIRSNRPHGKATFPTMRTMRANLTAAIFMCVHFTFCISVYAYASSINGLTQSLVGHAQTIGGMIAGIGGVMFGLGFASDSDEQKVRGLQTLIAGALIVAIAPQLAGAGAGANLIAEVRPWIQRLGNTVIGIGGVMFGLGFASDTAEQKIKGLKTAIAGCITYAAATYI